MRKKVERSAAAIDEPLVPRQQTGWERLMAYGLAAALVAVATGLRWALPMVFDSVPYLAFCPAIVLAAAFGGFGPGALATILTGLVVNVYFIPPYRLFSEPNPIALLQLMILLVIGLGISAIAGKRRSRERRQAEAVRQAIAERKAIEEAVSASERRFRAIFDKAGVGIVEVDRDDHFIAVNDRVCQILGYERDELLKMNVHQLTCPEDRPLSDRFNTEVHQGIHDRVSYEKRYLKRDGTPLWVHVTVSAVRDSTGRWLRSISTVEDISQRKQAEEELKASTLAAERAKAQAEEASRAKDHFLAVLSHELRTPLTPVMAVLSSLRDGGRFDSETRENLEMIHRNVALETKLIDDLLDVTRIARGKVELDRRPVELRTIIHHAVEVCMSDIEARRLHFNVDLGSSANCLVHADAARLQQVFWNLLRNAIKFTPPGGHVGIRCYRKPGTGDGMGNKVPSPHSLVFIEFTDSGAGIEAEALRRIFNAFEQAERSITRQFGGLGLGLTISKALVELHGGGIEVFSQGKDKGATFTVRLPVCREGMPSGKPEVAVPDKPQLQIADRKLKILLVEDHVDTANVLRRLLTAKGYKVKTAGTVAAALEVAEQGRFDLLISDLGLPDASGLELMRELRRRGAAMRAIALSGYGQEEDVQKSHKAGFVQHLTKPVDFKRLMEIIDQVMNGGKWAVSGSNG